MSDLIIQKLHFSIAQSGGAHFLSRGRRTYLHTAKVSYIKNSRVTDMHNEESVSHLLGVVVTHGFHPKVKLCLTSLVM